MTTRTETESKSCLRSWIRFNPPGSRTGIDYYNDYVNVFKDKAIRRAKFDTIVPEFGYEGFHNLWVNGVALAVAREYVNDIIPKGKVDEYYAKYAAKYAAPIVEEALAYLIYENEYIEVDGCWVYPAHPIEVPPVKLSLAEWVTKNPPYGINCYEYYHAYETAFSPNHVSSHSFFRFVECHLNCEFQYSKNIDSFAFVKKEKPKESQFTSIDLVTWITQNPRGETAMNDYYEKYIKAFGERAIDLNLFMKLLEFHELVQRVNSMSEKPKEKPIIPAETLEEARANIMCKIMAKPKKIMLEDPSEQKIEKLVVDPKFIIDCRLMNPAGDGMVNAVPSDTRLINSEGGIFSSAEFGHLRVVQEPKKPESGNSKDSEFEML